MTETFQLELEETFDRDLKTVYEQFRDLKKYGVHHPVMTHVKIVLDKSPEYIEYEIDEDITLFGFIRMYPNYKAKVYEIEKGAHIRYTSQVKKNIALKVDLYFSESNSKTTVKEQTEVTGNKIVSMMFLRILEKAHRQLFKNLSANLQKA